MLAKLERAKTQPDVWIDPPGYQAAVAERQAAFEAELKRELNPPAVRQSQ
jgi:hypothetical protein